MDRRRGPPTPSAPPVTLSRLPAWIERTVRQKLWLVLGGRANTYARPPSSAAILARLSTSAWRRTAGSSASVTMKVVHRMSCTRPAWWVAAWRFWLSIRAVAAPAGPRWTTMKSSCTQVTAASGRWGAIDDQLHPHRQHCLRQQHHQSGDGVRVAPDEGRAGLLQQKLLVGATTLKVKNRPCCPCARGRSTWGGVPVTAFKGVRQSSADPGSIEGALRS